MRVELQAKFLQHLNNKSEKGFTLVELLVVIIIIGILSAIAIPNFLNQAAKAKQTEAKQNIGMINRVQSIYRTQNNQFAGSFDLLAIGTLAGTTGNTTTNNYSYTLSATTESAYLLAQSKDSGLKGYSGGTNRYLNTTSQSVIASVLCEAPGPGTIAPTAIGTSSSAAPTCAGGYNQLSN
jgi:type IV pilus assembly protein PilA